MINFTAAALRRPSLIALAAMSVALAVAPCGRAEPVAPAPGPAWKLKDVDGREVSSAQFKGKVVVVDFWATWCPPCREEIPGYVALQKKYGKDGLVIVGVAVNEGSAAKVKKFMVEKGVNYPIVMGDEEIVAAFGGMDAIPTTFLLDRDGRIRDRKVGAVPAAEYERTVLAVLKK